MVIWELRQKQPVIDFHVLKERNFALATLSMLVLGFVLYGSTALLPLFLQTLLGYTAMLSGMVLSPGGIVICIAMPAGGTSAAQIPGALAGDFRRGGIRGGLDGDVALHPAVGLRNRGAQPHRAELRAGLSVRSHQHVAFMRIPRERMNYATGLYNLARNIGGSSGIAATTTILARRAQFHQAVLVCHLTPYDAAYRDALGQGGDGAPGGGLVPHRRRRASARVDLRHAVEAVQHAGLCRRLLRHGRVVSGDHSADVYDPQNSARPDDGARASGLCHARAHE